MAAHKPIKQAPKSSTERDRERRNDLNKAGLCDRCGNEPYTPGYRTCAGCRNEARERRATRYNVLKIRGFCPNGDGRKVLPGQTYCKKCKERMKDTNSKYSKRSESHGNETIGTTHAANGNTHWK